MRAGAAPGQREQQAVDGAALPQSGATPETPPAATLSAEEAFSSAFGGARMLGMSLALWLLYVPHYNLLRLLGPRLGLCWVRFAAHVHWLLTFIGAQPAARRALADMRPYFNTRLTVSQILRRHLLLKHECFARVRVYNAARPIAPREDVRWQVNPECEAAVPYGSLERGLLVVGYHFNFFQLSPAALQQALPGVKLAQLRYRHAQTVEAAALPVTRLALKRALLADRRGGIKVFYVDARWGLVSLFRFLRKGGAVMLAADGGVADDFIDVPFFDGTLRVPNGWAKLAAATKSDILLLADKQLDEQTRDGWFFNHVRCTQTGDEAAYAAVAESIRILEQMIRDEPWGWHPWQRLRGEVDADGVRRYSLKQYGVKPRESGRPVEQKSVARKPSQQPAGSDGPSPQQGRCRPRVAVIANSYPPYRVYLHRRILAEVPEVELWSVSTHGNAYQRWKSLKPPAEIRPVDFSHGEPTNEQPQIRYSVREWFKGGRIIRWLKRQQIDAVMVQGCGDMARLRIIRWCKRRGIPCFLTGDFNVCSDNHRPLKRWLKRRVYNRGVGWSHGLMPCGEHGLALLHRYGGRGKPTYMFPFVPDVELFQNTPLEAIELAREKFRLDPERRRIVFSARMMEAKRPDLAVASFATIADERPDWDLVMIGDGPLRAAVEASVPARFRTRVKWLGFLDSPEEIAGVYAQCDVMVLPSDHEPWGVVVVEAAASGLAIVASDVVGAAPELVKPGVNGALFPKGDAHALASALLAMTSPEQVEAAKGRSTAVLDEWLRQCDPVDAFRSALQDAGLIAKNLEECRRPPDAHSIRGAGEAVVPV
jgi:glycosyltransferase involved in cell wall biosynthesis/lauroyl/myristoyl acyltransferase